MLLGFDDNLDEQNKDDDESDENRRKIVHSHQVNADFLCGRRLHFCCVGFFNLLLHDSYHMLMLRRFV